jgi:hypothetical protein
VTGRHDHFAPPSWAGELAGRIGASLAVVPGGHNFSYTRPEDADRALRGILEHWPTK